MSVRVSVRVSVGVYVRVSVRVSLSLSVSVIDECECESCREHDTTIQRNFNPLLHVIFIFKNPIKRTLSNKEFNFVSIKMYCQYVRNTKL